MMDVFGLVGRTLKEQYRIDQVVGEGGFGVVYRGVHLRLEQPVAVKVLKVPAHLSGEARQSFQRSFLAEGKLLAKLSQHPSIVRVYDLDLLPLAVGEVPYLVLEWLDGEDLERWLAKRRSAGQGPLGEGEAVSLLGPALDALSAAHRLGVAHRDIKPANLFRCETALGPTVKVLDFGIAKVMQEGETASQAVSATASGFRAFSPHYGAAEQFASKRHGATGPWTDVHAMGLILSELVSGKTPFEGEELFELMHSGLAAERPTPRALGAQVSDAFEQVVRRAVSLSPSERYATAGELSSALEEAVRGASANMPRTAVRAPVAPTAVMDSTSGTLRVSESSVGATVLLSEKSGASRKAWIAGTLVALALLAGVAVAAIFFGGEPEAPSATAERMSRALGAEAPPAPIETATPPPAPTPAFEVARESAPRETAPAEAPATAVPPPSSGTTSGRERLGGGDASRRVGGSDIDDLLDQAIGGGGGGARRGGGGSAPTPTPAPAAGGGGGGGNLPPAPNRNDVMSAMNSVAGAVSGCAEGNTGLAPTRIVFSNNGRVSSAEVQGSTLPLSVRSCIARVVRSASVPPFSEPTFSVNYPFRL